MKIEKVKEGEKGEIEAEVFRRKFENFKGGKEWAKVTVGKAMKKILGGDSISRNGKRYYQGIRLKERTQTIEQTESGLQENKELISIGDDPRNEIPNWWKMKTKTEYLKDLELTTLEDKKELKKHYRKLVKIYNLDNGTSKNELRIKEVHSAYEALSV